MFPHAKHYHLPASASGRVEAAEASRRALAAGAAPSPAAGAAGDAAAPGGPGAAGAAWYCQPDAEVLKVLSQPGDAVLFYDYVPADDPAAPPLADAASLHAGCPPLEGTKLIATRWLRAAEFH